MTHAPVLMAEAIAALSLRPGGTYIDATFGGGGYSRAILEAAECRVLALDRDPEAIARGRAMVERDRRLTVVRSSFGAMREAAEPVGLTDVDGIVFDLGVSSFQLDEPARGFSFKADGPLDMRMAQEGTSAADLVAELPQQELERLFREYGDEPEARRVARAVVARRERRPIATTGELQRLVAGAIRRDPGRLDPATRVFQALRIAVNDEVGELARGLEAAEALLRPGGRLVVVAFHSGEDRLVKRFVDERGGRPAAGSRHLPPAQAVAPRWRWLQRRVVRPGEDEVAANPRARSARLRAAERLEAADGSSSRLGEGEWRWPRAA